MITQVVTQQMVLWRSCCCSAALFQLCTFVLDMGNR